MIVTEMVVDTSAWIELLQGTQIGYEVRAIMPALPNVIVPTIVQLELTKWLTREMNEDAADRVIALCQPCIIAPLTTSLALLAAHLHQAHKLATADAIIYATAKAAGAQLLKCDAHFEGLDHVTLIRKSTAG